MPDESGKWDLHLISWRAHLGEAMQSRNPQVLEWSKWQNAPETWSPPPPPPELNWRAMCQAHAAMESDGVSLKRIDPLARSIRRGLGLGAGSSRRRDQHIKEQTKYTCAAERGHLRAWGWENAGMAKGHHGRHAQGRRRCFGERRNLDVRVGQRKVTELSQDPQSQAENSAF